MEYSKKELRRIVKERRKAIRPEEKEVWDRGLFGNLKTFGLEKAKTVYAYISVNGEAETGPFIESLLESGVRVAVPLVRRKDGRKWMDFYYIRGEQDLEPGTFGLLEPKESCEQAADRTCPVIVPGVAFAPDGTRNGYGGGFYDRFFEQEPSHPKIGLAYAFQIFPEVEREATDIPVDAIVTPDEIIRIAEIRIPEGELK